MVGAENVVFGQATLVEAEDFVFAEDLSYSHFDIHELSKKVTKLNVLLLKIVTRRFLKILF